MSIPREELETVARQAFEAADGAFTKLPEITRNVSWSDVGKSQQRERLANETARHLKALAERGRALVDAEVRRAQSAVESRAWLDKAKLEDRRARFGPAFANMGPTELLTVIKRANSHDPELASAASDILEARLMAMADTTPDIEATRAELAALRQDPGTGEGKARQQLAQAQKAGEFAGWLEMYSANVPEAIRTNTDPNGPAEIHVPRLSIQHFKWDRPPVEK